MQVSVDIAMHPISDEFVAPIHAFIAALEAVAGIDVVPGPISTQVYGEFDVLMPALGAAIRDVFEDADHLNVFTLRIASGDARALEAQHPRA